MLEERHLFEIARKVASGVRLDQREDTYQQIWVQFLTYRPRTRKGAWIMAVTARNILYRDEERHRHHSIDELRLHPLQDGPGTDDHLTLLDMRREHPRALRDFLCAWLSQDHGVATRTTMTRRRQVLTGELTWDQRNRPKARERQRRYRWGRTRVPTTSTPVTADYRSDGHQTCDPALRRPGGRQPPRQR